VIVRSAVAALFVGAAVALSVCGASLASAAGTPFGTFNGCPTGLLRQPSNPGGAAPTVRRVALRFLVTTYAQMNRSRDWGLKLTGAKAGRVLLVRDWLPNGWVKQECGLKVWQRSLVAFIRLPAMEYPNPKGPCNDCAGIEFLLGKTTRGWTVWGQY
jgi:hypothetical protein